MWNSHGVLEMKRASEDTARDVFEGGQGRCVGHEDTETTGETTEASNVTRHQER